MTRIFGPAVSARRSWFRRHPLRSAGLVLGLLGMGAPLLVFLVLRWAPPPTTAFRLRHALLAADDTGVAYRWTDWEQISPHVAVAVMAAEDQTFFAHHGFDVASIQEAVADARRGGRLRGASTLSQQVAKNLFLWPGRSVVRKGLEAYLTVGLELVWTKRRILEVYLNVAEFGHGVFGIGAASERFFAKAPAAITADEAALLAAVLPNPARLRVDRPSAYVRERQSWIRAQMRRLRATDLLQPLDTP